MTKIHVFPHPNLEVHQVTLASGSATILTKFRNIYAVSITEINATPSGESFSYSVSGSTLTVHSSSGTSTANLSVIVIGR